MQLIRSCVALLLAVLVSTSAFAKTETLAERGERMCQEAGVPLEDCQILPPDLRGPNPDSTVATVTPEPRPIDGLFSGPTPAGYGTGKYGWCEDCTSLLAAAPVTPWSEYGGRQFQPKRDEDDRRTADAGGSAPGGTPGDSDPGDGDDGDGGDDGGDTGEGGEVCE